MSLNRSIVFLLSIALTANSAFAEDDGFFSGTYVGGAFAIGVEQFDLDLPGSLDIDEAFGVDLWVGYRFNDYVGVEGQFVFLKGFDIERTPIDLETLTFTANVRLYPLTGRLQPYVLGGIGAGRFEIGSGGSADDTGGVFRAGGGIDFYVIDSVALVAGATYLFTRGDITDFDILEIKLGAQYQF